MLWQDRRALRCIRNGVLWVGAVVTPMPIVVSVPRDVLTVAVAASTVTLLTVYLMLLWAITHR